MPQVADPSITVSTTTSDSSHASSGDEQRKTPLSVTKVVRGLFAEFSAILIVGYLINEMLTRYWPGDRSFFGLPNFWISGAVIGGLIGFFIVFQLYIAPTKKHP